MVPDAVGDDLFDIGLAGLYLSGDVLFAGVYIYLLYTSITFNSKEIAENLHKQGGFLEGVRGGAQTEVYLTKIVNRLTFFGALSLGLLAVVPIIAQVFISTSIAIGGTSVLILVSVALQTLRAVESRALMVTYDQYSQPDFFSEVDPVAGGGPMGGRLRFSKRLLDRAKK